MEKSLFYNHEIASKLELDDPNSCLLLLMCGFYTLAAVPWWEVEFSEARKFDEQKHLISLFLTFQNTYFVVIFVVMIVTSQSKLKPIDFFIAMTSIDLVR